LIEMHGWFWDFHLQFLLSDTQVCFKTLLNPILQFWWNNGVVCWHEF
jgi:hypothetical protein